MKCLWYRCDTKAKYLENGKLYKCKGCCVARYCSKSCQKKDWKKHKKVKVTENESREQQRYISELAAGLRFLSENYTGTSWYWELVEMVRKVILTSGLILIGGESRAYVGLACVISGLYGILFAYVSPVEDSFENKMMIITLAVTFVNLGIGAVSKIPKENVPASIDPYVDTVTFNLLVVGANTLVIGLLVGKLTHLQS